MPENYYNILEVKETASIEEIKKAYRRLSMMYHPDKNKNNPDATAKFQKISEAYETLGDEEKKKEYDAMRNNQFVQNGNPFFDFSGLFAGMPFAHMQSFGPNVRVFHNGVQINPNASMFNKPTPIIKTLIVPIDKILTGTTMPIDIERWIMNGDEKTFEHETIYINVPKGIDDGEMLIIHDKGNVLRDDCKGDIKIFIKMENNTDFKRMGLDLLFEKTIPLKEALCGFSFELKYISGKTYTINSNVGNIVSHGYKRIIPGMGLTRETHTGNLIIVFNVKFPEKLPDTVLEQLTKIDF
jgi:DnaJ family protein B protein 4